MTGLTYDPEYAKAIGPVPPVRPIPVDALDLRKSVNSFQLQYLPPKTPGDGIQEISLSLRSFDGAEIKLRRFATYGQISASTPQPAVLAFYGGGHVGGSVDLYAGLYSQDALGGDRPIFAVEYRLAPEHPAPAAVEDGFHALMYLIENAAELNIDPSRIAVKGESAGGGIATGVALLARDRKLTPRLAKQILVYPMLDDRTNYPPGSEFLKLVSWTPEYNRLGWASYLGEDVAGRPDANVSEYDAPARAESLKGLPATYIEVGTLDLFRDEDMDYAQRLMREDVPVEFHLWPGVPHAFEVTAPGTKWQLRAAAARAAALRSF